MQRAAVQALGGQLGGVVAMAPSGQILAVAGIGIDSLQPPGSTFKMITLTGVLQATWPRRSTDFPYATHATLDGVKLSNANGEECGGSLALAFAVSCNSVFAPLGVKLGAPRLVATAERFGFNHAPGIPGAAESTLPARIEHPGRTGRRLDGDRPGPGAGQRAADGDRGGHDRRRRPRPATDLHARSAAAGGDRDERRRRAHRAPADDRRRARRHRHLGGDPRRDRRRQDRHGRTEDRVLRGAERKQPTGESGAQESSSSGCVGADSEASNTDAWFAAFAPALHPRIVVGVLLVKDGAGGDTAAPVAREVLEAGLQATR